MNRLFVALLLGIGLTVTFLGTLKPVAYARPFAPSESPDILHYTPPKQAGTGLVRVGLTGSDVSGCGSVASPCATVQFAINEAIPGDTVMVSAGTYNESVTLSQPINLIGVNSATTIIQAVSGQRVLTVTGAAIDNTVVISGLTFSGGDVSGGNICFSGDTTNCGGGILLTNNAQPSIQNVIIENNDAYEGGGLYANETSGLLLDRVILRNNSAILSGGGLNAPNTPITVTNSLFQQNTTTDNVGGAVVASANFAIVAPVLISNTTFLSNTAQCGGGICEAPAVYLFDQDSQIIDSHFEGNSCTSANCDGGGVYMTASFNNPSLSLVNTNFINNTAGGSGGGVSTGNVPHMTVVNGRFENNRALSGDGGGLDHSNFLFSNDATINGTQFISNNATLDGGGLYSFNDIGISNATFERNSSGEDGGGLLIDSGGTGSSLTDTNFFSNTSQSEGGGAFVFSSNLIVNGGGFFGNNALADGGGLHACGNVTLTNILVTGNTTQENGGGVYIGPREGINGCGNGVNVVVVTDSHFEANISQNPLSVFSEGGGGLYNIGTLTVNGTNFISNQAAAIGGGVHTFGASVLNGGVFQNNTAIASAGGGIRAAGDLTVDGTQFIGNLSGFAGGGVQTSGPANIRNALFQNNQADNGGGLDVFDVAAIDNVQFINNTAITGTGGGLDSFQALTVTNSLFQGNSSVSSGGGLNTFTGQFNLINTQFFSNTALNGGGLNSSANSPNAVDVIIQGNTAINNGGGLATSGSANFSGNWEVSNNTAGEDGGGIWANSGLNGTNGRIENNTSGDSGGGFYGGLANMNVNGTVFANNQAGGNGGGAYSFAGPAIGNALFEENTAGGVGGGLFLHRFVHISTTQFLGNDANIGGGLAISYTNSGTLDQFVHNSLFARNTATANGAGIYWNQPRPINLIHNTIASPGPTSGAAIYIVTGVVTITNNIIANHTTGIEVVGGVVTETYNLFSGNTANTSGAVAGGTGSLTGNPAFQDPATDDYHLTNASQAINLGTDAGITIDFENDPRPGIGGFDAGFDETRFAPLLSVSKTATAAIDAPYHGQILYTVVISNSGDLDAINTMLTDTLPIEVDFAQFIQSNGAAVNSDEITWSGTVPVDTSLTFSFVVSHTGDYEDVFTNTVEIGHSASKSSATASAVVAIESQVANLLISKSSVRDEGAGLITYTIVVQNLGPHDAGGVIVSDPIPADISAFSWQCTPSGGATCTANGIGNINDTLTSFPVGGQAIYTVQATMVSTDVTVVNTVTLLLPTGLTNSAATNSATDISAPVGDIFLPIVMVDVGGSPPVGLPDLVIDSIVASSTRVTITVKNIGTGPVVDAFWVDVYINPNTPPTGVNQRWEDLGDQGVVWGVLGAGLTPLTPGGTLTLISDSSDPYYRPEFSQFSTPLVAPIYAQVDSINFDTNYGNVLESNEENNIDSTSIISLGFIKTPSPDNAPPSLSTSNAGLPSRQ